MSTTNLNVPFSDLQRIYADRAASSRPGVWATAHTECMRVLVTLATGVGGPYRNPEYLLLMFRWVSGMSKEDAKNFIRGAEPPTEELRACLWAIICTHTESEAGQLTCKKFGLEERLELVRSYLQAPTASVLIAAAIKIEKLTAN